MEHRVIGKCDGTSDLQSNQELDGLDGGKGAGDREGGVSKRRFVLRQRQPDCRVVKNFEGIGNGCAVELDFDIGGTGLVIARMAFARRSIQRA